MTITAPGPRRIDYGAVSIRVRGDCNHEWTCRTTKAAAIQQGRGEYGRSRIRLYCAECFRLGGPRHNLTYVVAVETTRKCACGNRLSVYNPGPCFACQRREADRLASAIVTIEDRVLDYLSQNNQTVAWLASVMRLSEPTVRRILNELVGRKQIELGRSGAPVRRKPPAHLQAPGGGGRVSDRKQTKELLMTCGDGR